MKIKNGFTLIELILVISIIGIMSSIAVPKYFSITREYHTADKLRVVGNIVVALNNWGAKQLTTTTNRTYPTTSQVTHLSVLMDEVPVDWTFTNSLLSYSGDGSNWSYTTSANNLSYTLQQQ